MEPARILIIDDDADIASFLKVLLELEGYEVHSATSGMRGLALAQEVRPDAVLLDMSLPDIAGLEVCAQLRSAGCAGPVVMVSARVEEHQKELAREAGAALYVEKPFRNRDLLAQLAKLLAPRRNP